MKILFFDIEVTAQKKIIKLWAINQQWRIIYNGDNVEDFFESTKNYEVLAWHNILLHDLEYLSQNHNIPTSFLEKPVIDTLWLSSLVFIRKPYHRLIKDYKREPEDLEVEDEWDSFFMRHQPWWEDDEEDNDPVKDSQLSLNVFNNCVEEFIKISPNIQQILYWLLWDTRQFSTFFSYLQEEKKFTPKSIDILQEIKKVLSPIIKQDFFDKELETLLTDYPLDFSYIFRLVEQNLNRDLSINPDCSILPRRIAYVLPDLDKVFFKIYKYKNYDLKKELKSWWLKDFRVYDNEHWPKISQEEIVEEWFNWWDFIAVLATWWWKSLCFQLPALARAEASWFLTIVISPLQSLMEDQVSNLKNKYHKINVWALHSWLDPLTRKEINEKVWEWGIDLLYLSPEMLRSKSTKTLLAKRHIDRLVIDEAHCFSKRWHDFRIDYMFIADFIKELGELNPSIKDLSVSCFTATAKQEVISEIKDYFKSNLGKELKEFKSTAKRPNLNYEAYNIKPNRDIWESVESLKFEKLINILENEVWTKPCIIFTRYTWKSKKMWAQNLTNEINERLLQDWYWEIKAAFFHWQLPWAAKSDMMYKFMNWEVNVIVATNAFWMWVDKTDVRFVIHYNMPASLENYLQEAGRAWRDQESSRCIILYSSDDLDENLQLGGTSKLKKEELQKLLKYIKKEFQKKGKSLIVKSPKDLIKNAWWVWGDFEEEYSKDKTVLDIKLKTALSFLEKPFPNESDPRFIKRWLNRTRRIATSTSEKNNSLNYVFSYLDSLENLDSEEHRVIKDIYREIRNARVLSIEDLPNKVGWYFNSFPVEIDDKKTIYRKGVEELVHILGDEKLIDMDDEIMLYLNVAWPSLKQLKNLRKFISVFFGVITGENWEYISEGSEIRWDKKQINTQVTKELANTTNMDNVSNLIGFLEDRKDISISWDSMIVRYSLSDIRQKLNCLLDWWEELINFLLDENATESQKELKDIPVRVRLQFLANRLIKVTKEKVSIRKVEDILKLLYKFWVINIDSWLFLYHTRFTIGMWNHLKEISETWKEKFSNLKDEHYKALSDFYKNKTQQAHIMDEFVQYILQWIPIDRFVDDYFNLDYEFEFLPKYFKWRLHEISRSISQAKYDEIMDVSPEQKKILNSNNNLLVIAWPWSWKTKSLVHKVAHLVLEQWVSKDEFLLLTFMRSAKFELKNRIIKLIWNQWYDLKIHTFHGFAYELLEKDPLKEDYNDNWEEWDQIIKDAIKYLNEHEDWQWSYRVIMLDEFQDIWKTYFDFVEAISKRSAFDENKITIIATWDDDQSIMEFKWWDIKYIQNFQKQHNADSVVLSVNFRSTQALVDYTTTFAKTIRGRLKERVELKSNFNSSDIFQKQTHIEAWNCSWNYLFWVKNALDSITSYNSKGTTAIICAENETVLQINHILQKKWIKAQILLWERWYKLRDALEIRYFLELCSDEDNKVTKDNIWDKYNTVLSVYWENKNTELLKNIVTTLITTNSYINAKIVRDFIVEIKDEADLIDNDHKLFISTFHKSKWREFDNVIICFDPNKNKWWNNKFEDEQERDRIKRLIYVWMTRAKTNLILLWNKTSNRYFEFLFNKAEVKKEVKYTDDETDEISVITSLKDIYLSYNDDKIIKDPRIGADIGYEKVILSDGKEAINFIWEWKIIQKSSREFVEKKLSRWFKKDYCISSVKVYQKILYVSRDDDKEHLVFVFDFSLKKSPKEFKEIEQAKSQINQLENRIKELSNDRIVEDNWNEELKKIIEERDAQIDILKEKALVLENKLLDAEKDIETHEINIQNNKLLIEELQGKVVKVEKEKEEEEMKVKELKRKFITAEKEWNDKVKQEYENKILEAQNNLKNAEAELVSLSQEKQSIEDKNWVLLDENQILKRQNDELLQKISEAKIVGSEPEEYLFKAWQTEEICELLINLIKKAKRSVILIEPYLDKSTFDLFSHRRIWVKGIIEYHKGKTLHSKEINGDQSKLTKLLNYKNDQEWNPIIVRTLPKMHDRFLMIDGVVWKIWTSINSTLWENPTTISKSIFTQEDIQEIHRV